MKNNNTNNSKIIFDIRSISKSYLVGSKSEFILQNIKFNIRTGELLGIIGNSGSGKSTLFNCLAGIENADTGLIYFEDTNLTELIDSDKNKYKFDKVGIVFRENNMIEYLTVKENLILPFQLKNISSLDYQSKVNNYIKEYDLKDIENTKISELDNYSKQLISLIRATFLNPKIILLDEPTGELHTEYKNKFISILKSMNKELKIAMVVFTHDSNVALQMNRIIRLDSGKLV